MEDTDFLMREIAFFSNLETCACEIPIIFAAVTDPVDAAIVDSMEVPGGNVTGTSDAISPEDIMNLAKEITPDFKTVGALYSAGEDNSASVIADLKAYADANGLTVIESTVTNTSEVQQAAQYLADKVDIVFSPIDNTVASAMAVATDVLYEAGVPFYVSADSMVNDGGLATYGIDYSVRCCDRLCARDSAFGAFLYRTHRVKLHPVLRQHSGLQHTHDQILFRIATNVQTV